VTLASGTRLGAYEILGPLGAGGMGEVYRARDPKLNRDVAIKILPDALAADPAALARFEREAQAVAALSHPNILAIHDFGRQGATAYAVMELLEGETLRARLVHGALPARKAAELATQIAEGLATAHEKGIVHRDLKPENIFVTHEGRAKILDFGLAKAVAVKGATATAGGSESTPTMLHTSPGTVLGTVGYMSPEQVRGELVDHRSDIFAFGVVLYEMLTGRRAFQGATQADTMSAILKEDPPGLVIAASGSSPSPALQRIVQHCLEKKPAERFRDAHDLAFALQAFSGSAVASGSLVAVTHKGWRPWLAGLGAVAVATLLGVAGLALYRAGERQSPGVFRQITVQPGEIYGARFSPDGREVLFDSAQGEAQGRISSVRLDTGEERALGLGQGRLLGFSGQGELAVMTDPRRDLPFLDAFRGTLALAPDVGTAPKATLPDVVYADISSTGEKAVVRYLKGRFRLECPIGRSRIDHGTFLWAMRFSPDGRYLAFWESPDWRRTRIVLLDLQSGETQVLAEGGSFHGLAWRNGEVLFATLNSGESSEIRAVSLHGRVRRILGLPGRWDLQDAALDGRLLLAESQNHFQIRVWNPEVRDMDLALHMDSVLIGLSADGGRTVFHDETRWTDQGYPCYFRSVDGSLPVFLGWGMFPVLSPNGAWAAAVQAGSVPGVVLMPTGPGETRRFTLPSFEGLIYVQWTVDGKGLMAVGNEKGRPPRIWRLGLQGEAPRPLTPEGVATGTDGIRPSPDGRFFVAESGNAPVLCDLQDPAKAPRPLPGLEKGEFTSGWTQELPSRRVYVVRQGPLPRPVFLVDVFTGQRERWGSFDSPGDRGRWLNNHFITPDGRTMAANIYRRQSTLFVLEGMK